MQTNNGNPTSHTLPSGDRNGGADAPDRSFSPDEIPLRGIPPLRGKTEAEREWDRTQALERDHINFLNQHGASLTMTPKIKSLVSVVIAAILLILSAFLPTGTVEIVLQAVAGVAGVVGITGVREMFDLYKSKMKPRITSAPPQIVFDFILLL